MSAPAQRRLGGQLNRSETVTVRLDPKLNYLCELAARSQRRTKSSLIEAALFDYLSVLPIDIRASGEAHRSIASLAEGLWDLSESQRFWRLANIAPHLMDYGEQQIWSVLTRNPYFWSGHWENIGTDQVMFIPHLQPEELLYFRLDEQWNLIKAVAVGSRSPKDLPEAATIERWNQGFGGSYALELESLPRMARGAAQ